MTEKMIAVEIYVKPESLADILEAQDHIGEMNCTFDLVMSGLVNTKVQVLGVGSVTGPYKN